MTDMPSPDSADELVDPEDELELDEDIEGIDDIDDLGAPPTQGPPPDGVGGLVAAMNGAKAGAIEKPPKSLPVLAAFQEFLEDERKRSRNRMLILSGFFLLILVSVVTCGTLVGMLAYKDMQADYDQVCSNVVQLEKELQTNVDDLEEDAAEEKLRLAKDLTYLKSNTEDTLNTYLVKQGDAIETAKREYLQRQDAAIAAARQEARESQERAMQKVRTEMATEIAKAPAAVKEELAGVKDVIDTLEAENARLKQELEQLQTNLPSINEQLKSALTKIKDIENRPPPAVVTVPRRAVMPVDTVSFSIQPGNGAERYTWRLPIPE